MTPHTLARWPSGASRQADDGGHGSEHARFNYVAAGRNDAYGAIPSHGRPTILDSDPPRRSTVMCALHWFFSVIHEYQSDSSSKKPVSSAFPDAPGGPAPPRTWLPVDNRSLHIR